MENPRIVGHVVAINGFRVKVEILKEARSPSRATLDGVQTAIAINSYLTFSIGAGRHIISIVTDLEARESYDPSSNDEISLELLKARRVVAVQLLGTVKKPNQYWEFEPGITILPTLDSPAEIGSPELMAAVFEKPPQKNKPDDCNEGGAYDHDLVLGSPTGGQTGSKVKASYNDLFSRSLAIVGNTGSGKSYSVASLLQQAMSDDILNNSTQNEPHVFILDINGEYARAFKIDEKAKEPNHIYLNGKEFGIPLWFFNSQEICTWLSAAEQAQEPVLKDWWAMAKARCAASTNRDIDNKLYIALTKIGSLVNCLDSNTAVKKKCCSLFKIAESYLSNPSRYDGFDGLASSLEEHMPELQKPKEDWSPPLNDKDIRDAAELLIQSIKSELSEAIEEESSTADTPLFIGKTDLMDPTLLNRSSASQEDVSKIEHYLSTLKLRLKTRLDDKRWQAFLNYEQKETKFLSLVDWLEGFGFQDNLSKRVSVLDLSMLSHDTLPYACAVLGRILLESREKLPAAARYKSPWVLVLEEAHNYARPTKQLEEHGQALSRSAFERIAKEGRKFGLSLIVASQRPSEISPTIISQCANFISHRLQNPDDIEHFRRIIPMQARRLLDQVTVLDAGEAIVFGSAFHIPARVQISKPSPEPWSQTAAPFHEWKTNNTSFPLDKVIANWGLNKQPDRHSNSAEPQLPSVTSGNDSHSESSDNSNDGDDYIPS